MTEGSRNTEDAYHVNRGQTFAGRSRKRKIFVLVVLFHIVFLLIPLLIYTAVNQNKEYTQRRNTTVSLTEEASAQKEKSPQDGTEEISSLKTGESGQPSRTRDSQKALHKQAAGTGQKGREKTKRKSIWLPPSKIRKSETTIKIGASEKIPGIKKIDPDKFHEEMTFPSTDVQEKGRQADESSKSVDEEYFAIVTDFLTRHWDQPNQAQLDGRKPQVVISFSVDADGKIKSSRIVSQSGNEVMDESVRALLKKVSDLPKPPHGELEFRVTLKIVE